MSSTLGAPRLSSTVVNRSWFPMKYRMSPDEADGVSDLMRSYNPYGPIRRMITYFGVGGNLPLYSGHVYNYDYDYDYILRKTLGLSGLQRSAQPRSVRRRQGVEPARDVSPSSPAATSWPRCSGRCGPARPWARRRSSSCSSSRGRPSRGRSSPTGSATSARCCPSPSSSIPSRPCGRARR